MGSEYQARAKRIPEFHSGSIKSGRAAFLAPLILVMALAPGCSRQPNLLAPNQGPVSGRPLPFENPSAEGGNYPTASLAFLKLPPGTLLTVRIRSAISSATCHQGDFFAAVLDEPLVLDGQTVLARGAEVSGRVVAAKASGQFDPGYLRLRLTGISVSGKPLRLETSSVFLKGGSRPVRGVALIDKRTVPAALVLADGAGSQASLPPGAKNDVEFPAAGRLTFRLSEALPIKP
jgi:hypothetical protein